MMRVRECAFTEKETGTYKVKIMIAIMKVVNATKVTSKKAMMKFSGIREKTTWTVSLGPRHLQR